MIGGCEYQLPFYIPPPPRPNQCYEYPPPLECPPYYEGSLAKKSDIESSAEVRIQRGFATKGTHVYLDMDSNVVGERFIHWNGMVEELL